MPPSAVAAIRYLSSSSCGQALPGLRGHLDGQAERAGPLVQLPDRHPPRHRAELVHRKQDLGVLPPAAAPRAWPCRVPGEEFHQRLGLRLGDRRLRGAFQDAVPHVGVVEAARSVEPGAEPPEQRAEPQRHVGDLFRRRAHGGQRRGVGRVREGEPVAVQPGQESGRAGGWPARRRDRQRHHRLHHVGVVGGARRCPARSGRAAWSSAGRAAAATATGWPRPARSRSTGRPPTAAPGGPGRPPAVSRRRPCSPARPAAACGQIRRRTAATPPRRTPPTAAAARLSYRCRSCRSRPGGTAAAGRGCGRLPAPDAARCGSPPLPRCRRRGRSAARRPVRRSAPARSVPGDATAAGRR